jgi:hypothetical protein
MINYFLNVHILFYKVKEGLAALAGACLVKHKERIGLLGALRHLRELEATHCQITPAEDQLELLRLKMAEILTLVDRTYDGALNHILAWVCDSMCSLPQHLCCIHTGGPRGTQAGVSAAHLLCVLR